MRNSGISEKKRRPRWQTQSPRANFEDAKATRFSRLRLVSPPRPASSPRPTATGADAAGKDLPSRFSLLRLLLLLHLDLAAGTDGGDAASFSFALSLPPSLSLSAHAAEENAEWTHAEELASSPPRPPALDAARHSTTHAEVVDRDIDIAPPHARARAPRRTRA